MIIFAVTQEEWTGINVIVSNVYHSTTFQKASDKYDQLVMLSTDDNVNYWITEIEVEEE